MRDSNMISSHPHQHGDGSVDSPESALHRAVSGPGPVTAAILREEGFNDEAITFAMDERLKSAAQLEREGWNETATDFLLRHGQKSIEDLRAQGLDETAISIIQRHVPDIRRLWEDVEARYGQLDTSEPEINPNFSEEAAADKRAEIFAQRARDHEKALKTLPGRHRQLVLREHFPAETLRYFAGPQNSLRTSRDLARDGLTINSMGLDIEDQPFNPLPPPKQQDPWDLETEGVVTQANRASRRLWLGLKYWDNMPVLRKATMLSKPTKRIWLNAKEMGGLTRGFSAAKGEVKPLSQVGECMAVSTDRGVMEVRECAERRVGGMVLCRMW